MTDTEAPSLLPCPFCGSAPAITDSLCEEWFVYCKDILCKAAPQIDRIYRNRDDAISAWNTRPTPPSVSPTDEIRALARELLEKADGRVAYIEGLFKTKPQLREQLKADHEFYVGIIRLCNAVLGEEK